MFLRLPKKGTSRTSLLIIASIFAINFSAAANLHGGQDVTATSSSRSLDTLPMALRTAVDDSLARDVNVLHGLDGAPLDWLEQKVLAGDGSAFGFGGAVAIQGTTAIIGAPYTGPTGVAYVFTEVDGTWSQVQMLTPSDAPPGDYFGSSIALSGTTALIGSYNQNPGAAYVFTESGGTWTQSQKLTVDDGAGNDSLGYAVALDGTGTIAIVGAIATVNGNDNQGAAYVFKNTAGTWSLTQKLTADDGVADDYFGAAIAIDGATVVIGAPGAWNVPSPGAAYIFTDSGDVWTQSQKLTASDGEDNGGLPNLFGGAVGLQGTTALIGAYNATINGVFAVGAAYIFTESAGAWSETQKLTASDGAVNDDFGGNIAINNGRALIGAVGATIDGGFLAGAVYMFDGSSGSWTETHKFVASDAAEYSYYSTVALDGSTVLIGAYYATTFGPGAAYFYSEPEGEPVASIVPGSLSFELESGESGSSPLTIANTGGGNLTYVITEAAATATLVSRNLQATASANMHRGVSTIASSGVTGPRDVAPWAPRNVDGGLSFILDDGTYEDSVGLNDGSTEFATLWLDRFAAPTGTGAFTVDSISILWPQNTNGSLVGRQVNLLAYYDADGDGNPGNAVRLGGDHFVTIGSLDSFENYTVNFSVPGAGDVYVGFENTYALGGSTPILFPAAIDEGVSQGHSWVAGMSDASDPDPDTLANNDLLGTIDSFGLPGNWLIRATGSTGDDCSNPSDVPWLTEAPTQGSVAAGASQDVLVTADATGLSPDTYSAVLCVATNDPVNGLIEVPVSLTVTTDPDAIFQDGFDGTL